MSMKVNQGERIRKLNNISDIPGECVIYIMSRDQRTRDNAALYEAQRYALNRKLPLMVIFHLYSKVKHRTESHTAFMLEGLKEVELELTSLQISFVITTGNASSTLIKAIQSYKAAAVFFDFSPLRGPRKLKNHILSECNAPCYIVDAHNIVPLWVTSEKEEWAAYTIRPKINKLLPSFLSSEDVIKKHPYVSDPSINKWDKLLPNTIRLSFPIRSGPHAASQMLKEFIHYRLSGYNSQRNDPVIDRQSNLSPYLHFGQISSKTIVLEIQRYLDSNPALKDDADAFMEEIIIRKELSDNFCYYNIHYDSYEGLRPWAKLTLEKHAKDKREFIYSLKQFKSAATHDKAWNAAQKQMVTTGKMHGYMRMYWAKKILEWTSDAQTAIQYAITLNDTYSLDGYDPNGYTGIMWSIGGIHDRPWFQRPVYGTIRYMSFSGLAKKFDINEYIAKWS